MPLAYGAPLGTHRYPPLPGVDANLNHKPKNQKLKANINVASLNMNGFAAPNRNMSGIEKWSTVYRTINDHKIAVLALQETHLDDNLLTSVHECFGKRLSVVNSKLPGNPRASAGVAFVLNRALIAPKDLVVTELIEGRALAIKFKWHNDDEVSLINVYAPNTRSEHQNFWELIDTRRRSKSLRRPDILLGDFNVTEELIDRAPAHLDDTNAIAALRNLRQCLSLEDSWRHAFPHERAFTYRATINGQAIMSRLDRIYTSNEVAKEVYDWKNTQTSVPTDHWMVSVKYAPLQAPFIGTGRWTMQLPELKNEELLERLIDRGMTLQTDLQDLVNSHQQRGQANPQSLWASFKKDIVKLSKKHCSESRGKLRKKIAIIEKKMMTLTRNPSLDTDNGLRAKEAFWASELANLKHIQARDKRDETRAVVANHGEVLGGVWSGMNKDRKPRDIITRLKTPNPQSANDTFERDSRRMAKLARDYHDTLQYQDIIIPDDSPEWIPKTAAILGEIPGNQHLSDYDLDKAEWILTYEQVEKALHLTKNGTATGLDGCPYELWKELDKKYKEAKSQRKEGFDIVAALTSLFTDIQNGGVVENSDFASGWMCPIYKKKDRSEISNYRPITLLNTDYKLLTKTLALQLVEPIHKLIHPDQAGFIPKRSIFNHIRLATTIINYAEVMEVDGEIVALDQEKAYDKIRHEYLWSTMEALNLPAHFVKTVKSLYSNAYTQVAINGVLSNPFRVIRGVRQGDPLSCLLFDLAIEPLACKLRNCAELKGLAIPGVENKLIVNLFADDTTIYLSSHDRFDTVEKLLASWCEVSGAKFNIEKTEIIPIGTIEHRLEVVRTRKLHKDDEAPLDTKIHVAGEGVGVRSLGAWIGNNVKDLTPWEIVLDKITRKLEVWGRFHPTVYGKQLIIQAVVGGHTQFLTKAQGMPPHIEVALMQIIRDFIWDNDTHPRISLEYLHRPINEGGLNILDIRARNDAIELVWLRDYLNLTPTRQTWAIVSDILINATAPPGTSAIAIANTFLQSWDPPTKGPRLATLNEGIRRMLKVAKKYNTNLAAIRLSPGVRATLPAWYHPYDNPRPMTNVHARCMLNKHATKTVADLIKLANKARGQLVNGMHVPNQTCICRECVQDRRGGCKNPHACALEAVTRLNGIAPKYNPLAIEHHDTLSLTPNRKKRNRAACQEGQSRLFDPTITCKDGIQECFRIFTSKEGASRRAASRRPQRGAYLEHVEMEVYTDGACMKNGKRNAACGSGIWIEGDHPLNKALKVPGARHSNQIGEIAAVIVAAESLPNYCKLKVLTDSRYVIEGLTEHLEKWEDAGWIGIKNAEFFKRAAYLLKRRSAPTIFEWVKGHKGVLGNEESDKLAKEGATKDAPDTLSLSIPEEFDLQGAKLATITQATAYRGIRESSKKEARTTSDSNIEKARHAIIAYTGTDETSETIWSSIRKRTIRLRVQQFLFKAIHNTPMVGEIWLNIEGFQQRGSCTPCGTTENMNHILLLCTAGPVAAIWNMAKELWPHENARWPEINMGTIFGCGCLTTKDENRGEGNRGGEKGENLKQRGATRLLQIIISEAAHLIWVLRCERVIQEKSHTQHEVTSRWLKAINRRLTDDKITATIIRKNDTPFTQLVEATWEDALRKISDLPNEWIIDREFLVGRRV